MIKYTNINAQNDNTIGRTGFNFHHHDNIKIVVATESLPEEVLSLLSQFDGERWTITEFGVVGVILFVSAGEKETYRDAEIFLPQASIAAICREWKKQEKR